MVGTIDFLRETFKKYNTLIFNNRLPVPYLRISKSTRSLGSFRSIRGKGDLRLPQNCDIALSRNWDLEFSVLEDVVIHEMIHYYIWYNNLRDTSSHGRIFKTMMNEINNNYNRNVQLRTNSQSSPDTIRRLNRYVYYIALARLKNGDCYFMVSAKSRIKSAHRMLKRMADVENIEWMTTNNSWFSNFRCVKVFRLYALTAEIKKEQFDGKVFRID